MQLWENLGRIVEMVNEPWIMSGDFNVILRSKERKVGLESRRVGYNQFNSFMFDHGFLDIRFHGPCFTWNRGNLFQRLDRSLCNDLWQSFAPNSMVKHLHKLKSDHHPNLLLTDNAQMERADRQFRFLASWFMHPEFKDVVTESWQGDEGIARKLEHFTQAIQNWNKIVFGNIFARKR